jgi:Plavaka transposase
MATDEPSGSKGVYSVPDDSVDITDANAFEELLRGNSTPPNLNQLTIDDALETLEDTTQQSEQIELDDRPDTADQELASGLIIDQFPFGSPGAPIPGKHRGLSVYESLQGIHADNPWAPFSSQLDWEVARWAKMRSRTSTAVTELLAIPGVRVSYYQDTVHLIQEMKVVKALGLSFCTVKELNEKIDDELPACPPFRCKEVSFGEERLDFHYRDVMQCIRAIYGDPQFAQDLVFAPERHYTNQERTCRVYNEIHTGDWWWKVQVSNTSID